MGSGHSLPTRRREAVWMRWRAHVEAQRASGQTQKSYCRKHGLCARYFCVWKKKLKLLEQAASRTRAIKATEASQLQLVPVVIQKSSDANHSSGDALTPQVTLPNGLSVCLSLPSVGRLPLVLEQLAVTRC
jgi:hypothetical protein